MRFAQWTRRSPPPRLNSQAENYASEAWNAAVNEVLTILANYKIEYDRLESGEWGWEAADKIQAKVRCLHYDNGRIKEDCE